MEIARTKYKKVEINMIPLINIIFLLLIFFMVAGTVEIADILEVTEPEAKITKDIAIEGITIYMAKDGKIAVNKTIIDKEEVDETLNLLLKNNNGQIIKIKSDGRLDASKLVWVMDIIANAGGKNITLITKNDGK